MSNLSAIPNKTTRRKAFILLGAATLSFLVGLGYGSAKRYEYTQQLAFVEPLTNLLPEFHLKPKPPDVNIKIKAVGDIVPGTNYPNNRLHSRSHALFQDVKPILQGADILFGNFESTLTNYPYSSKRLKGGLIVAFRTPPSYAQILKEAGFDVMSVANNHSYDFSHQGFTDTIYNLEKVGIKALGKKGQILIANRKELSIAWIGFSYFNYHNSLNNLREAKALVRIARKHADVIVVSVHAGSEGTGAMHIKNQTEYFFGENRGNLVQFSHTMVNSGADLILGHGPHVPRALELYKGKLIAYSLGNFMGYRTLVAEAQLAYSLVLEVEMNNQGDFVSGKIIPVHLTRQGIPYPDRNFRSVKLIRQLTQDNFPKTRLTIDKNGRILPKKEKIAFKS